MLKNFVNGRSPQCAADVGPRLLRFQFTFFRLILNALCTIIQRHRRVASNSLWAACPDRAPMASPCASEASTVSWIWVIFFERIVRYCAPLAWGPEHHDAGRQGESAFGFIMRKASCYTGAAINVPLLLPVAAYRCNRWQSRHFFGDNATSRIHAQPCSFLPQHLVTKRMTTLHPCAATVLAHKKQGFLSLLVLLALLLILQPLQLPRP